MRVIKTTKKTQRHAIKTYSVVVNCRLSPTEPEVVNGVLVVVSFCCTVLVDPDWAEDWTEDCDAPLVLCVTNTSVAGDASETEMPVDLRDSEKEKDKVGLSVGLGVGLVKTELVCPSTFRVNREKAQRVVRSTRKRRSILRVTILL